MAVTHSVEWEHRAAQPLGFAASEIFETVKDCIFMLYVTFEELQSSKRSLPETERLSTGSMDDMLKSFMVVYFTTLSDKAGLRFVKNMQQKISWIADCIAETAILLRLSG